jgi:Flp pilus assembly protein TadB
MTMNRELRRAQAKQDKKVEREKEERKAARRRRIDTLRSRRAARRAEITANAGKKADAKSADGVAKPTGKGGGATAGRGRNPGRFAGALAMATVFFIVLQASVPPEPGDNDVLRSVTGAGFYLLFGYFSILWLMRRETPRPLVVTLVFGVLLTAGVEVAKLFQPEVPTDLLLLVLAVPGLVAGAFLGRLVYTTAPR